MSSLFRNSPENVHQLLSLDLLFSIAAYLYPSIIRTPFLRLKYGHTSFNATGLFFGQELLNSDLGTAYVSQGVCTPLSAPNSALNNPVFPFLMDDEKP